MNNTLLTHSLLGVIVTISVAASVSGQSDSPGNTAPPPPAGAPQPQAAMGMMAGEVTDTSALVQIRLTATDKLVDRDSTGAWGIAEFTAQPEDKSAAPIVQTAHAFPQRRLHRPRPLFPAQAEYEVHLQHPHRPEPTDAAGRTPSRIQNASRTRLGRTSSLRRCDGNELRKISR